MFLNMLQLESKNFNDSKSQMDLEYFNHQVPNQYNGKIHMKTVKLT